MNRFALPPTRGSSIEFKDQDGNEKIDSLCTTFELLPPALHDPVQFHTTSASSYSPPLPPLYPMSAVETVRARRRLTAASAAAARASQSQDGGVTLPPPPTRTRKIINIKVPKGAAVESSGTTASKGRATAKGGKGAHVEANGASKHTSRAPEGQREGNEKQPSALSAAGRKMSRRTAHTIIERRRRCRMNEEFAKLKGMIPACTGDMHKLSILQASIDYIQYLEACVAQLKAHHEGQGNSNQVTLPSIQEFHLKFGDHSSDMEMSDSEVVSPAAPAQDARGRQYSYSSVSTDPRHYSYSASATASPTLGPQGDYAAGSTGSTFTSPMLRPQADLDQEAMAALLMLNSGQREVSPTKVRKGVSLQDLVNP